MRECANAVSLYAEAKPSLSCFDVKAYLYNPSKAAGFPLVLQVETQQKGSSYSLAIRPRFTDFDKFMPTVP